MPRLLFSLSLAVVALTSIGTTACTTHTIVKLKPQPTVTFDTTCALTACEAAKQATPLTQQCKDCMEASASVCADDVVLCDYDNSSCAYACRGPACDYDPNACAEYKWVVRIGNLSATPGVEEACIEANAEIATRCGWTTTDDGLAFEKSECARSAFVSTDAAIEESACHATIDCHTFQAPCTATSSFGDDLCATRAATCGTGCTHTERILLNAVGVDLKPEIPAAETCAQQTSCREATACMTAWWALFE